jgi:hypothetical protein
MHTLTQLSTSQFRIDGLSSAAPQDNTIFPAWTRDDRFGIVINDPLGGVGASHLIQLAICAFYDSRPECRAGVNLYPEIYAFHLGQGWGSHAEYDFWPPRRETVVSGSPQDLLDAILDRAVTRLALPEAGSTALYPDGTFDVKEVGALEDRLRSAFVYSSTGRVQSADFALTGIDRRTEVNPQRVLNLYETRPNLPRRDRMRRPLKEFDPQYEDYQKRRAQEVDEIDVGSARSARESLRDQDGHVRETYQICSAGSVLTGIAALMQR